MAYIWDIPGWNSGAKVRRSGWERGHYIYRKDDGTWGDNIPIRFDGLAWVTRAGVTDNDWELYTETPAEVEVFEWMRPTHVGCWFITDHLMTEAEAAENFRSTPYRKTGRSFKVPVAK